MEKEETDAKIKYFIPAYMKNEQLCGFCIGSSSKTFKIAIRCINENVNLDLKRKHVSCSLKILKTNNSHKQCLKLDRLQIRFSFPN